MMDRRLFYRKQILQINLHTENKNEMGEQKKIALSLTPFKFFNQKPVGDFSSLF